MNYHSFFKRINFLTLNINTYAVCNIIRAHTVVKFLASEASTNTNYERIVAISMRAQLETLADYRLGIFSMSHCTILSLTSFGRI